MTESSVRETSSAKDLRSGIIQRFVQVFVQLLVQALVLFLGAGTLRWWEAWTFIGLYLLGIAINSVFMLRLNPATIVERGRAGQATNWKAWDKVVGLVFTVFYFIGILLVAGLDQRFGWTAQLPMAIKVAGFALYALGSALLSWAMISNAFFSTAVRIQDDRGQTVCDRGPYRLVRHPGYVGIMVQSLAQPVMLGSLWALIAASLAVVSLIVRTSLEDRLLRDELHGYRDYSRRVRYRLLPGIW